MGDRTGIEYLRDRNGIPGATWNVTSGCSQVSEGCEHCWARTVAETRLAGFGGYDPIEPFKPTIRPDKLRIPLAWRRPRNIAVSFMGDLFHDEIPLKFIAAVYGVMAAAHWHTFVVCTKRPKRALEWAEWVKAEAPAAMQRFEDHPLTLAGRNARAGTEIGEPPPPTPELRVVCDAMEKIDDRIGQYHWQPWPLPNVVFLFSAETQARFDERVADALAVPAVVHGVSLEPLLLPVDLAGWLPEDMHVDDSRDPCLQIEPEGPSLSLDWVIVGCESGPQRRPMDDAWARVVRDQCVASGVPFYLKQMALYGGRVEKLPALDGRVWDERPSVML